MRAELVKEGVKISSRYNVILKLSGSKELGACVAGVLWNKETKVQVLKDSRIHYHCHHQC